MWANIPPEVKILKDIGMFDLGASFLASVERTPHNIALVDGPRRWSYEQWLGDICALGHSLRELGLRKDDHLVTVLQNNWQAATIHWACQMTGIIVTPINWRAGSADIEFTVGNAGAKAIVWQDVSAAAVRGARGVAAIAQIRLHDGEVPEESPTEKDGATAASNFDALLARSSSQGLSPEARPEDWSVMLYTSGTTAQPKGVPRRHRVERAAALAHVAQNAYLRGEATLGVMPLYHTMGIRSLLAMSLVGGKFVCLSQFSPEAALDLIVREQISNLYLVPTLYHDLLHHPLFAATHTSSVTKLGFAGASMTDDLLHKLDRAFKPQLFVNHYGSSEIYTFSVEPKAAGKPGSAGKAGLNQVIRVVKLGASSPEDRAATGEEGQIIATLAGDEAFEGYWHRPEADAKSLREGWYFTGDTGYLDEEGDLFVTGRVDDMIISGGENISPVEVESCLSLHPAVEEVAVVGLPDERWGQAVSAFIKRSAPVSVEELDAYCRSATLAPFKRPRRYVFVSAIPKSPVGKLLRRFLVSGDYEAEGEPPAPASPA